MSCVANKCYFIRLDLQLRNLIQGLSHSQCNSYNGLLRCKANDRLFGTCTFCDLFIKVMTKVQIIQYRIFIDWKVRQHHCLRLWKGLSFKSKPFNSCLLNCRLFSNFTQY